MLYDVDLKITLRPIWHSDPPLVRVACHDRSHDICLDRPITTRFLYQAHGDQQLSIQLLNKSDQDTIPHLDLDKAVVIDQISFFGISDPLFIWRGQYQPIYPEPWAGQQRALGHPPAPVLTNVDRLSWNGVWRLGFELPVFTWVHKVQDLGWIYS